MFRKTSCCLVDLNCSAFALHDGGLRRPRTKPGTNRVFLYLCYNPHPRGKQTLANLSGIMRQLKKERDRVQQQLSGLNAALEAFAGVYRGQNGTKPRRKMSAKGRASIAAAQRARWAKVKGKTSTTKTGKRTMSVSARRKIAAAQRARWARTKQKTKQK
jgi:hypothetical protein